MSADDAEDLVQLLRGSRTCRECLHPMDPWRSRTDRLAWSCRNCGRFEI